MGRNQQEVTKYGKKKSRRNRNYDRYEDYSDYSRQQQPQRYRQGLSDIEQREQYQAVYRFAYNTDGLNLNDSDAKSIAFEWMNRDYCEDAQGVNQLWEVYKGHYNFAYSTAGMNMNSFGAKNFAINKLKMHSRCSDLLR